MLSIVKVLKALKTFKNTSIAAKPFEPLMKYYGWSIVFKTIILVGYITAVNFYNCPFEEIIEACVRLEEYNFVHLMAFAIITRLFEMVNYCIMAIQKQELEAFPPLTDDVSVQPVQQVEPKKFEWSLKIATVTSKIISVVGFVVLCKAFYKGFYASSISNKYLGIS